MSWRNPLHTFRTGLLMIAISMGACWPAAAEICPQPAGTPIAAQPSVMKWHEKKYADRLAAIERDLNTQEFTAIALGDSIIQGWPAEMLTSAVGAATLNAGVNGDTTQALLWRLQTMKWSRQSPRDVLVLIGTNNGRFGRPESACETYWGIRAVIDKTHQLFPSAKIIVVSILPRGEGGRESDGEIGKINQALQAAAARAGFSFVDVHGAFLCKEAGDCNLLRPPGYVHPNRRGYELLSRLLRQQLAQRLH